MVRQFMNMNNRITIRPESWSDYDAILRLTYEAFLTLNFPERRRVDEHYLIALLRGSDFVIPELSFVAEMDGAIVGHILYTKSKVVHHDGTDANTITFGPLSVLPKYHRLGIGKGLVLHSIEKAKDMGFGAVLIVGVPEYYPKLGFKRAREYALMLADGVSPDAFMAYELTDGYLHGGGVCHFLAPEYEIVEKDDEGYDAFNRDFMSKLFHGKLILRPFFGDDIALMERWLYADHVKPWYECPLDWLNELRERFGEFGFIAHMIAEVNGVAVGFCQYYDCYNSKGHEDWGVEISSKGEVSSIDYLIGEPEYLRLGYGKEMIAVMVDKLCAQGVKQILVLPSEKNIASNRALEANGFAWDGVRYSLRLQHTT